MGIFRDMMERDLQIRGFSPSTQQCYLGRMKEFVRYFMPACAARRQAAARRVNHRRY